MMLRGHHRKGELLRLRSAIVAVTLSCLTGEALGQTREGAALVEDQAAYLARCRREMIAAYPNARAQADTICRSRWGEVVAASPMADAIFAVAPASGRAFDPATARAKIGRPRGITLAVTRRPSLGVTLSWNSSGEPISFNLEDAMAVRGARLSMIACQSFGSSEGTHVYSVNAAGKAPFALTIAFLNAAVASQSSNFTASVDFSGRMPSLTALRRDGGEWTPECPK